VIDAIRHILINDSRVNTLVNQKDVVALNRAQGRALPAIVIDKQNVTTSDTKGNTSGMDMHSVLVHCFDQTWVKAYTVAMAVRSVLDNYTGVVSVPEFRNVTIEHIRYVTDGDQYFDDNESVSSITVEFNVMEKRV
jgi:hypothetical protein